MSRIGFIGLGNMGLPMAINLAATHDVIGFDLSPDTKAALVAAGGAAAETIEQAVAQADVVVSMLPAGKHVESVYLQDTGVLAHAKSGTLLIDSSTIDVDTARKVSAAAQVAGFSMVDAPVSGGVGECKDPGLINMAGVCRACNVRTELPRPLLHQSIFIFVLIQELYLSNFNLNFLMPTLAFAAR